MADLAQLERALRNADAAGDTDAARKLAQAIVEQRQAQPKMPALLRAAGTLGAGALRGAGSIGATLLTPYDLLAGNTTRRGNPERRQAMDDALSSLGFDTSSLSFKTGKLGAEVAGTAGVGGGLAKIGQVLGATAPMLSALTTGGINAGGVTGLGGAALRAGAGAATGAAATGLVSPDDAALGGVVGGVMPGAMQLAGAAGRGLSSLVKGREQRAVDTLIRSLEMDPRTVAAKLAASKTMVRGADPTVAQVLRTPQAATLERIVSDTPGGAMIKQRYAQQNAARLAALDDVAAIDPRGFRSAQDDLGTAALDAIRKGDAAARARTSAAYDAVPRDAATLYPPNLEAVRDAIYTKGSIANREAVDRVVAKYQELGFTEVPALAAAKAPASSGQTLAQAVRKAGGVNLGGGLRGEAASLRGELKNLVRPNTGRNLNELAEMMHEAGYLADDSVDTLLDGLRAEAHGRPVYSAGTSNTERAWRAAAEAAMGDAPGAQRVPKQVTLGELTDLRSDIKAEARGMAGKPEMAKAKKTLEDMARAIDDRINEVVRGDGAIDENLPLAWADQLTEAQRLKRAQVEQFRTGPQSEAFRMGADGLPKVQGGEFAAKVWGNRPGVAHDIQQFRKVLDEHPKLLGQFRSMITTEGASTATSAGNLTNRFVRWVDNALPGLKASFDPHEVKMLQRIAADIKRADAAIGAARQIGSPTYANMQGALSAGLLDNRLLDVLASRTPVVGQFTGPMLSGLRQTAKEARARELAGLLADPARTTNLLSGLLSRPSLDWYPIQRGLLSAAPIVAAQ